MEKANYLGVFIAFIYGYVASEYLAGWGNLMKENMQPKTISKVI